MGYWNEGYWGEFLWASEEGIALDKKIHEILAPGLDPDDTSDLRRWRNVKCDVLIFWTHIWHSTDALLTNDKRIIKKAQQLAELGANRIVAPVEFELSS